MTSLPRHCRVSEPPRLKLTPRDARIVCAVYQCRVLRRDQIQRLLFPSTTTANDRLKRLYHHRFLQRRWLPVEYGDVSSQRIYLLDEKGADWVAERLGVDRGEIGWRKAHSEVGSVFLEHTLMVNDVRIAFRLAAEWERYKIDRWTTEDELKTTKEYVFINTESGRRRRMAVIPDSYFVLNLGDRRAHFFLEVDRATVANRRWGRRVQAYEIYARSWRYTTRFETRSLRVLTVTTGPKRLSNLKRTTERAGGGGRRFSRNLSGGWPTRVAHHR